MAGNESVIGRDPGGPGSRLFFSNYTSCLKPFEDVLSAIAGHYSGWEIVAEYEHSLPLIKNRFRDIAPSYDMKFQAHAPLSDINIASPNEKLRATAVGEVVDCIRTAGGFGMGLVTFHPGFISPLTFDRKDLALRLNRESIEKIDAAALDCGVKAAIENMPKLAITIGTTFADLKKFVEGTEVRICFDIGHANTCGSIDGFLEKDSVSLIANVHLHDNMGDRDTHMIPGEGSIDFPGSLKRLGGYKGNFVFESKDIPDGISGKKKVLGLIDNHVE